MNRFSGINGISGSSYIGNIGGGNLMKDARNLMPGINRGLHGWARGFLPGIGAGLRGLGYGSSVNALPMNIRQMPSYFQSRAGQSRAGANEMNYLMREALAGDPKIKNVWRTNGNGSITDLSNGKLVGAPGVQGDDYNPGPVADPDGNYKDQTAALMSPNWKACSGNVRDWGTYGGNVGDWGARSGALGDWRGYDRNLGDQNCGFSGQTGPLGSIVTNTCPDAKGYSGSQTLEMEHYSISMQQPKDRSGAGTVIVTDKDTGKPVATFNGDPHLTAGNGGTETFTDDGLLELPKDKSVLKIETQPLPGYNITGVGGISLYGEAGTLSVANIGGGGPMTNSFSS